MRYNYAYLISDCGYFHICDISDPSDPQLAGGFRLNYAFNCYDIHLDGDYAYIATGNSGVNIMEVFDPENPALVRSFESNAEHM